MLIRSLSVVWAFLVTSIFCVDAIGQVRIGIDSVELDRDTVYRQCQPGMRSRESCDDSISVRGKVLIKGLSPEEIAKANISYAVSGGRITDGVGGSEFTWDLSGVSSGEYLLTIILEPVRRDTSGITRSVSVTVADCPGCSFADACPEITLQVPNEAVRVGNRIEVRSVVTGGAEGATFLWTVSNGSIISGQGTGSITIDTVGLAGEELINVNMEIQGIGSPICETHYSGSIALANDQVPILFDEFPTLGSNCEEANARLDAFFIELAYSPGDSGVIVIYDSPTKRNAAWFRERQFRNFIKMRHFDPSRLSIIRGTYRQNASVQFWRVPAGADNPDILGADAPPPPAGPEPTPTQPYLYATEFADGLPECTMPMYDLAAYAVVLNSEPRSMGRIVIAEATRARFDRKRRDIASELAENGISRGRVTYIFRAIRANRALESTELWVIPSIKR